MREEGRRRKQRMSGKEEGRRETEIRGGEGPKGRKFKKEKSTVDCCDSCL